MTYTEQTMPTKPPLRTFLVSVERFHPDYHVDEFLVEAEAYSISEDAVSFAVTHYEFVDGEWLMQMRIPRTVRPYLDIEEITTQMAVTTGRAN